VFLSHVTPTQAEERAQHHGLTLRDLTAVDAAARITFADMSMSMGSPLRVAQPRNVAQLRHSPVTTPAVDSLEAIVEESYASPPSAGGVRHTRGRGSGGGTRTHTPTTPSPAVAARAATGGAGARMEPTTGGERSRTRTSHQVLAGAGRMLFNNGTVAKGTS